MKLLVAAAVAAMVGGCAFETDAGSYAAWSHGGAGGAAAGEARADAGAPVVSSHDAAGGANTTHVDLARRSACTPFLEFQDSGGFWCALDSEPLGELVETFDAAPCLSCYLVRCDADGFARWVPVECSGLGQ